MADDTTFKLRFSPGAWRVVAQSLEETRDRGQRRLTVAHLLHVLAVVETAMFAAAMREWRSTPESVKRWLELNVGRHPAEEGAGVSIDPEVRQVFRRALAGARRDGRDRIEAGDLVAGARPLLGRLLGSAEVDLDWPAWGGVSR